MIDRIVGSDAIGAIDTDTVIVGEVTVSSGVVDRAHHPLIELLHKVTYSFPTSIHILLLIDFPPELWISGNPMDIP